jgi:hypothetical protein
MTIRKQLQAMARVARRQGDKESAAALERVAQWARTFKGWQAAPLIGPHAPSLAMEHAAATGAALAAALKRGESCHAEMWSAWRDARA